MVNKTTDPAHFDEEATYPSNTVMRGTTITDGHGIMKVERVGDATEIGKVARQATEQNLEETPLNIQLSKLASLIGKIGFTIAALTFIIFTSKDLYHYLSVTEVNDWHQCWTLPDCAEILHDGSHLNRGCRTGRIADERYIESGTQHATHAQDQQPGAQNACLRNNGCNYGHLYG